MNSEQQHAPRSLFSLPFFISFALSFSLCTANPWCVCRQFPHYSNGTLLCKGLPPTSSSWREKERKQAPSSRCCCSKAAVPLGSGQCECSLPGMTTRVDHNGEESGRLRDVENEKNDDDDDDDEDKLQKALTTTAVPWDAALYCQLTLFAGWSKIDNWYRQTLPGEQCFPFRTNLDWFCVVFVCAHADDFKRFLSDVNIANQREESVCKIINNCRLTSSQLHSNSENESGRFRERRRTVSRSVVCVSSTKGSFIIAIVVHNLHFGSV